MTVKAYHASELYYEMQNTPNLFLLDVRNTSDYEDWKIEGKKLESINIPYFEVLEDESLLNQVPTDRLVIVICAKGGSAKYVAELLQERGIEAGYLAEGMKEWSQFYTATPVVEEPDFKLFQVNRLAKGCLSYVLVSQGEALVVDPARHIDIYQEVSAKENAKILHIIDTHLHADHITGAHELATITDANYYISSSEMKGSPRTYQPIEEHRQLQVGSTDVKVLSIPTPGHTPGSISILINDLYLLSGDTIFVSGLGRPDLGGKTREWAQSLYDTVFTTITNLSDDVLVLPAHFASVQEINENQYVGAHLGEIRKDNETMRTTDREAFTDMVTSGSGATPPNFETIIDINRGIKEVSTEQATELEIGPNRCAVHHS